jgi:hypothetical protein
LEEHEIGIVISEKSKRVSILLKVSRSESLISGIEEDEELLSLDEIMNLVPLFLSRVATGGVVSANVE